MKTTTETTHTWKFFLKEPHIDARNLIFPIIATNFFFFFYFLI